MGRYDFRPARVLRSVTTLLETKSIPRPPPWFDVVQDIPPPSSQTLVRLPKRGKRSRMFKPLPITYPEDQLRSEFFGDHPWELARPKVVLEDNGNNSKGWDWSRLKQPGKRVDGESVIQRQMHLMKHSHLPHAEAYDIARHEFYSARHLDDVERQVAREEAQHYGAYFGKGPNEIGMELEDQQWELWKEWAIKQIETQKSQRAAAYSGTGSDEEVRALSPVEEQAAFEEVVGPGAAVEDVKAEAAFVPAPSPGAEQKI